MRGMSRSPFVAPLVALAFFVIVAGYWGRSYSVRRTAKEGVLKGDLFTLRAIIEQYTLDRGECARSTADLVAAGYLKKMPKDPMTAAPTHGNCSCLTTPQLPVLLMSLVALLHMTSRAVGIATGDACFSA